MFYLIGFDGFSVPEQGGQDIVNLVCQGCRAHIMFFKLCALVVLFVIQQLGQFPEPVSSSIIGIQTFGLIFDQRVIDISLSRSSARADVHAGISSPAVVPAFPSWGAGVRLSLAPRIWRTKDPGRGWSCEGLKQFPHASHATKDMLQGENTAYVKLKPQGFLPNVWHCIRRQNQSDHRSEG